MENRNRMHVFNNCYCVGNEISSHTKKQKYIYMWFFQIFKFK